MLVQAGTGSQFKGNGFSVRIVVVRCRNELFLQLLCEYMSVATSLSTECITHAKKIVKKMCQKNSNIRKKIVQMLHCCVVNTCYTSDSNPIQIPSFDTLVRKSDAPRCDLAPLTPILHAFLNPLRQATCIRDKLHFIKK